MSIDFEIYTKKLWDGVALAQNSSLTSEMIDLTRKAENWRFSLQYYFTSTGAATITVKVLVSNDGVNFVDTDTAIGTNLAKDTHDVLEFDPSYCRYIQIEISEDDVAAITELTVVLTIA